MQTPYPTQKEAPLIQYVRSTIYLVSETRVESASEVNFGGGLYSKYDTGASLYGKSNPSA